MVPIIFSRHATARAQQRGIRPSVIDFILQHFDVDLEAGNGCRSYRISHRATAELLRDGVAVSEIDRAKNVVLIVHVNSGEVVTVMHDSGQDGRRHRRQWPTWKRSSRRRSRQLGGRAGSRNDEPYLEIHHVHALGDGGSDHPLNVAAVCPNCHSRVTHGKDADAHNTLIMQNVKAAEAKLQTKA